MRTRHYEVSLQIPNKGGDPEVRLIRLIQESHYATGRHDVHSGRMVVIDGGQWFLEMGDKVYRDGLVIPTYRTNRTPRQEQFLGVCSSDGAEQVDPNSPFAQSLIKGLYFFGAFTSAVRGEMLTRAHRDWMNSVVQRQNQSDLSYLTDQLRRGRLTRSDVEKVLSDYYGSTTDSSAS